MSPQKLLVFIVGVAGVLLLCGVMVFIGIAAGNSWIFSAMWLLTVLLASGLFGVVAGSVATWPTSMP